jgi:hypothetical protein
MGHLTQASVKPPQKTIDTSLGSMALNPEDCCWTGLYNGYRYHIPNNEKNQPTANLIDYCAAYLSDKKNLEQMLTREKNQLKVTRDSSLHHEIDQLTFVGLMFTNEHDGQIKVLVQLSADGTDIDDDSRVWSMVFVEQTCIEVFVE